VECRRTAIPHPKVVSGQCTGLGGRGEKRKWSVQVDLVLEERLPWLEIAVLPRHPCQHHWAIVAPDPGSDPCSAHYAKGTDPMSSAIGERPAAPVDRRWLVLVVVAIAQLMVVLDTTMVVANIG
jgi:hypothetical protein